MPQTGQKKRNSVSIVSNPIVVLTAGYEGRWGRLYEGIVCVQQYEEEL